MPNNTIDLNNPIEIRTVGMKALRDALGPIGLVKFIQQYDPGYGNFTLERREEPDISLDSLDCYLK